MGVNTETFTVYGYRAPYKSEFGEVYYTLIEDNEDFFKKVSADNDVRIIADGMGSTYIMIVKVLFESGNSRWGEVEDTHEEIDMSQFSKYAAEIDDFIDKVFPSYADIIKKDGLKLITFTHYS